MKVRTADYQKAKKSIINGIKLCIQCRCSKHGVTTLLFSEWNQVGISSIDGKINDLSTKLKTDKGKKIKN